MQSIKNKLHLKNKKNGGMNNSTVDGPKLVQERTETVTTQQNGTVVDEHVTKTVSETPLMNSSCPVPPPMPPSDFWMQGAQNDYGRYFEDSYLNNSSSSSMMPSVSLSNSRTFESLPTQMIEMPAVVHESIRREEVEEIQPVIQIEREKTEIRQITLPLVDKEIRSIVVEDRTLPIEILPTIMPTSVEVRQSLEESTRTIESTLRQVVEKAPIIKEVENWRVIEEIQPIIYREVIVPHVIRTSRPMREVVVEQPIFSEVSLHRRDLHAWERQSLSSFMSQYAVPRYELNTPAVREVSLLPKDITTTHNLPLNNMMPVAPVQKRREIITDEVSTTTTTTVAATAASGLPLNGSRSIGQSTTSAPVILDKKHTETRGLAGEKVVRDTVTTQTTVRPAAAI